MCNAISIILMCLCRCLIYLFSTKFATMYYICEHRQIYKKSRRRSEPARVAKILVSIADMCVDNADKDILCLPVVS